MLQPTIDFGQRLNRRGKKIWVRFVLVPGLTSSEENVENVARICESFGDAVEHIDVLPFHQLGRPKWHELRIPYPLEDQKDLPRRCATACASSSRATDSRSTSKRRRMRRHMIPDTGVSAFVIFDG